MNIPAAGLLGSVLCVSLAAPAPAQDSGAVVAASAAVTNLDSRSELTVAGSAGYRFNRSIGIEIEITAVPTLKAPYPTGQITVQNASAASSAPAIAIFPSPTYANPNGRAVFFTNNVRVEIPTPLARLTPYFVGGGGVATVRHTADFSFSTLILTPTPVVGGIPCFTCVPGVRTITEPVSTSSTELVLTIGGGLNVSITSHFSLDGDLRFFRLLGTEEANAGRFGIGARYRF